MKHGRIKITKCNDSQMWYSHLIGQEVELIKPAGDCGFAYWATNDGGHLNIISKRDAEIVDDKIMFVSDIKKIVINALVGLQRNGSDPEMNASISRDLLCDFLKKLGHADVVEEYNKVEKHN